MFTGYERAVERFTTASKSKDPTETFIPLFEALNWAAVLDERTGSRRRKAHRALHRDPRADSQRATNSP
jgi:hypothetical protein